MFMINVIFRFEKYWASFDIGERESVNDGEAHMGTVTHDLNSLKTATHSPNLLLEDCDYDHSPLLENYDYSRTLFIN